MYFVTMNSAMKFQLFDDKVVVDYYVLGRAVLGNDSYPMLFKELWLKCQDNKTLWHALGLDKDPDYDLIKMMQLNEVLLEYQGSVSFDTVLYCVVM